MDDAALMNVAGRMVETLPKWGAWASAVRDFETPWGSVGYRQLEILWILRQELLPPDQCSPSRLAAKFHVQPSVLTGVVARLEQGGFITRRPNPADSRVTLLQITENGIRVSKFVEEYFDRRVFDGLKAMSDDDVAKIAAAVDLLNTLAEQLYAE